jgi:hypothetical protein
MKKRLYLFKDKQSGATRLVKATNPGAVSLHCNRELQNVKVVSATELLDLQSRGVGVEEVAIEPTIPAPTITPVLPDPMPESRGVQPAEVDGISWLKRALV